MNHLTAVAEVGPVLGSMVGWSGGGMGHWAIVAELGLTVVGLVAFVVWQTVTLRRDMRATRERRERSGERDG